MYFQLQKAFASKEIKPGLNIEASAPREHINNEVCMKMSQPPEGLNFGSDGGARQQLKSRGLLVRNVFSEKEGHSVRRKRPKEGDVKWWELDKL